MNLKNQGVRVLLLCAACLALLSGCNTRNDPQKASSASNPPSTAESAQSTSVAQPETAPNVTAFQSVMDACTPILQTFPPSDDGNYTLTTAEYQKLIDAVGALGVPAVCYGVDPVNMDAMQTFWTNVQVGKSGSVTIYGIYCFTICEETFSFTDDKFSHSKTYWNYNSSTPEQPYPAAPLNSFRITENGYALYQENAGDFEQGSGFGFRVVPLGKENDSLLKKYVYPVDTMACGVLIHNWSKENFSGIDWEFTYEALYFLENNTSFKDVYPPVDTSDSPYRKIPAAEVDGLLQRYFPVTAEALHTLKSYDAQTNTYLFTGFLGGGYSSTAEVVAKTGNADGSITLTIQFAAPEFGKDCASTSYLTIMPSADGSFRYLRNETDSPRRDELNFHDRAAS